MEDIIYKSSASASTSSNEARLDFSTSRLVLSCLGAAARRFELDLAQLGLADFQGYPELELARRAHVSQPS